MVSVLILHWILDTGASHHMTANFPALTHIYTLSLPITISQPNGRQVLIEKAGMVKLGPDIILKDVLYTLNFQMQSNFYLKISY